MQKTSQLLKSQKDQLRSNYHKSYKFKIQFSFMQSFLKKIFYNFVHYHIQWSKDIYNEILSKLRSPLFNFYRQKQKIHANLNNLLDLKNKQQYRYQKQQTNQMQIRIIEFICHFDQFNQNYNNHTNTCNKNRIKTNNKVIIDLNQQSVIRLFIQFGQHLITRLSKQNLIKYYKYSLQTDYRMAKIQQPLPQQNKVQIQILQYVLQRIDQYNEQIIGSQKNYQQFFKQQLSQIITENSRQISSVLDIVNSIIADFMDFFNSQNKDLSYVFSYSMLEETLQKVQLIPDQIYVGLFVLNIRQIKKYITEMVNHQLEELTKDLPEQFRMCYNQFYNKLINFSNKINLSVWTIEEFVVSFQHKEMFQQYREEQIYKDQEKVKNILSAVNKTLPKTYEQCYMMFLKLKDIIQKIQTKVQTFDLNCIKKLKFFSTQIDQLCQNIWKDLIEVRNKILDIDNFNDSENFAQNILNQIPVFQQQLRNIKKSIDRLSYIQALQIRFSLKQSLTKDFNIFEKSQSDVKLIQSLLKKLMIFEKNYKIQMKTQIDKFSAEYLLQQINNNKSQIKLSQKYIISYQKILTKIYEKYDSYKRILQTADQLAVLQKQQIYDVMKTIMVDNVIHQNKIQQNDPNNTHPTTPHQINPNWSNLSNLLKRSSKFTLQDTIRLKLYQKYDQIHYQILKKQKKKKMQFIISNIQINMNDIILQVQNMDNMKSNNTQMSIHPSFHQKSLQPPQNKSQVHGSISRLQIGDSDKINKNPSKNQINLHSGFVNLSQTIKLIQDILNQLRAMVLSPFLQQEKTILLEKIQYVTSSLDILNLIYAAQNKVQKLIEDNILTEAMKQIQKTWSSHHIILEHRLFQTKEISFDNKLQKDVINAWYLLLKRLCNKKVSQINLCFKQQSNDLSNFISRLNSFQKIVHIKIQQKKTIFPFLYFFPNSDILKFVISPQSFASFIFPCSKLQKRPKKVHYDNILRLDIRHITSPRPYLNHQKYILTDEINNKLIFHIKHLSHSNRSTLKLNALKDTITNIIHIRSVVFTKKYSSIKNKDTLISNLMGQIKVLYKKLANNFEFELTDYKSILIEMLISARIDYRNRLENNFLQNNWIQDILVYYVDAHNRLYLRNLNQMIPVKYCLIDSSYLVYIFPQCQKSLVKICEAFTGQLTAMQVKQTQPLKLISSKLMYQIIQQQFDKVISQDICRGIVLNYPIFFLAKFEHLQSQSLETLLRYVQKIKHESVKQRLIKQNNYSIQNMHNFFTVSSDSICLFLQFNTKYQQIPHNIKSMYKSLSLITPSYELLFVSKLFCSQIDTSNLIIQQSLYIVNGFFYVYRQTIGENANYNFVNKLLTKLVKQFTIVKDISYKQTVQQFFIQYFVNMGIQSHQVQNFFGIVKMDKARQLLENSRESFNNKFSALNKKRFNYNNQSQSTNINNMKNKINNNNKNNQNNNVKSNQTTPQIKQKYQIFRTSQIKIQTFILIIILQQILIFSVIMPQIILKLLKCIHLSYFNIW